MGEPTFGKYALISDQGYGMRVTTGAADEIENAIAEKRLSQSKYGIEWAVFQVVGRNVRYTVDYTLPDQEPVEVVSEVEEEPAS